MATKKKAWVPKQTPRRIACVYDSNFYEGASVREAYEECDRNLGVSLESCLFFELRKLKVEMQIIERLEPVVVG